ncbi:carbohydrate kinase [Clostridia bacterium]|nr:carbohydrate kinase [Clostridia bacterium]
MNYLAFDLGASSGKIVRARFDGNQLRLETVSRFENHQIRQEDGLYWDFPAIQSNMLSGIAKAAKSGPIDSFGIDTFCNDFSFIDASGKIMAPIHSYRDERTLRTAARSNRIMPPRKLYELTGNQRAPFNTLMQLAAMRIENKAAVLDEAAHFLFLPDLLAYGLTGEILTERTVSSVSQMYSFETKDWIDEILNAFRIPRALFGKLTDPGTISGRLSGRMSAELGAHPFDFVSVCEHDTASAFLASAGTADSLILSSGTWSVAGCENEKPIITDFGFENNIANEGSIKGCHRILKNVMGSWLLQELIADYRNDGVTYGYEDLTRAARQAKPEQWSIDVDDPIFFLPGDIRKKIRTQCLVRHDAAPETLGEFARVIEEGLALKYRMALEQLEELTGRHFAAISVIGGGTKDSLLCQLTANICGRPVLAGHAEATSLGNILVQMLAHGEIKNITEGRELIAGSFPIKTYDPK